MAAYNARPIERLWHLGLLTPALNAVHMVHLSAADIGLAQRTGISITVCPQTNLQLGNGLPPIGALGAAGIRLGLGSGGAALSQDIWGDMRFMGLVHTPGMRCALPRAAAPRCWGSKLRSARSRWENGRIFVASIFPAPARSR